MFSNYVRIAFRNLLKNKGFSFINILGLTLGIASSLLILLFVFYELSYDKYHKDADRVYRLAVKALIGDTPINQTFSSARVFRELTERYPEIEGGAKIFTLDNVLLKIGDQQLSEPKLFVADSTLFDVMTYDFILGDAKSALNRPNTIVITKSEAERFFGTEDVLGKYLEFDLPWTFGTISFEISGLIEDIPSNSHLHFGYIASMMSFPGMISNNGWSTNNFVAYLKLKPGGDADELEAKFVEYVKENMGDRYDSFIESGNFWAFFLQPLTSIHLSSDLNGELEANGNKKYVYIFSAIALFVLIIACINFMNLSTAKSALRAREVGMRKLCGSTRGMLIRQFLSEAIIISTIALLLGVQLTELVLPGFRNIIGKPISLPLFSTYHLIPLLIIGGILIGILSGIYPAFFLSAYKPVTVLKGKFVSGKKGIIFRNILVVTQFAASIFLIIGTIVVQRQISFLQNTDIGFEKDNIMVVQIPPGFEDFKEPFKQEVLNQPEVQSGCFASGLPGSPFPNIGFNSPALENSFTLNLYTCDEDYLNTLNMSMIEGRFLSKSFITDSTAIVLNETAVRVLGLDDPIGVMINNNASQNSGFEVVGVIKDFNYESMHSQVRPMALFLQGGRQFRPAQYFAIKLKPGNMNQAIQKINQTWVSMVPNLPFSYTFLEDNYNSLYANENLTRRVFSLLCLLAILVASLGLFGLASFITEQRRKEVGIRKVMGAPIDRIILLLTSNFSRWVGVAFVIAAPSAWFIMNKWLQNFEYRMDLAIWIFVASGALALIIALLTISTITWRAATRNPVECLRYE